MKKNIVLIDYENVQKHNLRPLLGHDVLIKVFHGQNQKFTSEFTRLALEFGREKFELIQIKGQGKNAADFHIAYFIGKLSKEIPNTAFHIISRDTGFKVLADFLNQAQGISCRVESSIADMPLLKTAAPHVTFFVTRWYSRTDAERAELRSLFDDGHDVEPHTVNHLHAPQYVRDHGLDAYLADELMPSIVGLTQAGYPPANTFAYPFGEHTDELDLAIFPVVPRVRVGPAACPY